MPDLRLTPSAAASRFLNRVRTRGPTEVLPLVWVRTTEWFSSANELVMFTAPATGEPPERDDLEFRSAVPSDASRYARDIGTDSETTFVRRLRPDTQCFLITAGPRIAHASWVTTGGAWTRELQRYVVPPSGDAYIYESFTRGEARGRGIYPFALRSVAAWGAQSKIANLWVAVEADNEASLRAVAKAGFGEAFRVPYSRRLGRVRIGTISGPLAGGAGAFLSPTPPTSRL